MTRYYVTELPANYWTHRDIPGTVWAVCDGLTRSKNSHTIVRTFPNRPRAEGYAIAANNPYANWDTDTIVRYLNASQETQAEPFSERAPFELENRALAQQELDRRRDHPAARKGMDFWRASDHEW